MIQYLREESRPRSSLMPAALAFPWFVLVSQVLSSYYCLTARATRELREGELTILLRLR